MNSLQPPEILFSIGGWQIHTYGIIIASAVVLALLVADRRAKQFGCSSTLVQDSLFWALLGGIVGARIGFVVQELPLFLENPGLIPQIWTGGLSFHGGLIGGILAGYLYLRRHHQLHFFWRIADVSSAPLLLGVAIGRLGNWANQELYGYPSQLPWAIPIDEVHRLPGYEAFARFHPTFAYEALLNILGFLILARVVERQKTTFLGRSFAFALGWYALSRGLTEIWRISDRFIGPFSLAQIISIGMIVVVIYIWKNRKNLI